MGRVGEVLELAQCLSESAASPDLHSSPLYPIIMAVVITPAPVRQVSAGGRGSLRGQAPSNLPRFRLSLFAGFTDPSVFSRGLFCIDDGADKRPARCSSEL